MANIGNNEKVSLPSGAELEMTLAPFLEGERLLSAIAECIKDVKIDGNTDVNDLMSNVNNIKDMFLNCLTSQKVKDATLACLKRCTYNKNRITSWDIFDDMYTFIFTILDEFEKRLDIKDNEGWLEHVNKSSKHVIPKGHSNNGVT